MAISAGSRNLIILGIAVILFTLTTTTISLALYRNSGDIYLDRSRPGFLPDEDETKDEPSPDTFTFSESGKVDQELLEDYLKHYHSEIERLKVYDHSFSEDALSDESLGI